MSNLSRSRNQPGKKRVYQQLVLMILVFLICVLFAADSAETSERVYITQSENKTLLYCGSSEAGVFLVTTGDDGGEVFFTSSDDQAETLSASITNPTNLVNLKDDAIGILVPDSEDEFVSLMYVRQNSGQLIKEEPLFYSLNTEHNIETLYAVAEGDQLCVASPGESLMIYSEFFEGEDPLDTMLLDVEFLSSTIGGWTYAYSGNTLYRWRGRDFDNREEYSASRPVRIIGEDAFIDDSNMVCILDGVNANPIVSNISNFNTSLSCVANNELYSADVNLSTVQRYSYDGELTGSYHVDGSIVALMSEGVLINYNNAFYYSRYYFNFETEEPVPTETPVPSETASPTDNPEGTPDISLTPTPETPKPELSPEPDNSEEPSYTTEPSNEPGKETVPPIGPETPFYVEKTWFEKEYVILKSDMSVRDLREYLSPQAVLIRDKDGNPVAEGRLKTGMTMDEKVIVVLGDCDCSGYITSRDIYIVEEHMVDLTYFQTDAVFLAADMDMDGEITTKDLVMLSSEITR